MKKSLRLLLGTLILGAFVAGTTISKPQLSTAGGDPMPVCPPGGCAVK